MPDGLGFLSNPVEFVTTAATKVTLPTTGTLATLTGTETLAGKTLTNPSINEAVIQESTLAGGTVLSGDFSPVEILTFDIRPQQSYGLGNFVGLAFKPYDRTATVTGATTGTIAFGYNFVEVTSSNSSHIIKLPQTVVGYTLILNNGSTGYNLASDTPASVTINGGSGGGAVSAIPANSTVFLTCVSLTAWKGFYMDADGNVVKVPAAV